VLLVKAIEPGELLCAEKLRLGMLGERQEVFGVPVADGINLSAHGQTLQCVLADRLQQHYARLAV
jgi:hypothetical protein